MPRPGMPQPTSATGVVEAARVASHRGAPRCSVRSASILAMLLLRCYPCKRSTAMQLNPIESASRAGCKDESTGLAFFRPWTNRDEKHSSSIAGRHPVPSRWFRSRVRSPRRRGGSSVHISRPLVTPTLLMRRAPAHPALQSCHRSWMNGEVRSTCCRSRKGRRSPAGVHLRVARYAATSSISVLVS